VYLVLNHGAFGWSVRHPDTRGLFKRDTEVVEHPRVCLRIYKDRRDLAAKLLGNTLLKKEKEKNSVA
jgi:hypothetical protein